MKTEIYKHIEVLVNRYPVLNSVKDEIVEAYFLLVESYKNEGKLLIAGNGGSAADAEHIVGELMKGFKLPRKLNENFTDKLISENEELGTVLAESLQGALPAIALDGHPALSTAYMNDCEPLLCFAQQVNGYGKAGDVFLGISTSGNSKNILYAATTAHAKGMKVIGLTGSQQYKMMERVRETLAGRIGILELYSLSAREKAGVVFDADLDFSLDTLQARQRKLPKNDVVQVFNHIWEGGMPQVQGVDDELRQEYFNSYIDTYLMRDVAESGGITDTVRFRKFLVGCAALVSEQVNYSTLAESADIASSTAKEWLKVLVGLHIVYLLAPYSNNELKRLSKTPKLYFCDTGLCAYLSMWLTADTLRNGAASGHYYENYVVMELVKNYAYAKSKVNITYFRDSNAKEIDVFLDENNVIHPLEIKKSASPDRREVKKYSVIDKASLNRGNGGIICMCEEPIPIDKDNCFIPSNLI